MDRIDQSPNGVKDWARGARGFRGLLFLLTILVAALVLYASWLPSDRLVGAPFIPSWIAGWLDSGGAMRTGRTALPLIFFGGFITLTLKLGKVDYPTGLAFGFALILIVIAEGGQFFLPARTASWGDVGCGLGGGDFGIGGGAAGVVFS